ncbi:MAG: glycosyltransferase [Chloroflexi bacterium]|nr:glycosyltransferase [Chloroflexota bacterium]
MKILVLSPYPPYPPRGGGAMRIYQIVRWLAQRHAVTCLTFAPDDTSEAALAPLRDLCHLIAVRGPAGRSMLHRAWTTIVSPLPDMALRNVSPAYTAAVRSLLAREDFDVVQAESIELAAYLHAAGHQYATIGARRGRPLLVLDQFNAEYVLQKRAALTDLRAAVGLARPGTMARRIAGGIYSTVQWLKLARYERQAMQACDVMVAVSDEDRRALERLGVMVRCAIVPNGVDVAHFSRTALAVERSGPLAFGAPTLVFSGTLDFRPNIDALAWFAEAVLPLIRTKRPDTRLLAVGRRPAPALQRLAAQGALTLTGEVADARPYIAAATVYVVPMRIGGGIRLKLLEALSLEAPTVSTSLGAEGVAGLCDGVHCLLADTPHQFAAAVLRLLDDPVFGGQLGAAGRDLVRARYDWASIVPRLEAAYQ